MRVALLPPFRRVALLALVGGLAVSCAQTDRPTLTEDRLDEDSAATLSIDPDAPAPGPTADDAVTGDRVEMDHRPATDLIAPAALMAPEWVPGDWQPDALDVDAMITACATVATMAPARDGFAGPIRVMHDPAGVSVVQAIFQMPDTGTAKLTELKESLDHCDGTSVESGTVTVEAAPAAAGTALADTGDARLLARLVLRRDDGVVQYGDLAAVSVGELVVAVLVIGPTPTADAGVSTLVAAHTAQLLATP